MKVIFTNCKNLRLYQNTKLRVWVRLIRNHSSERDNSRETLDEVTRNQREMSCELNGGGPGSSRSSNGIQIGSAWFQRKVNLRPQRRGIHLVTEEVLRQIPEISQFNIGLAHFQLLHTSASLALNESWDPDVREDMEMMLNRIVPEGLPYRHSCEGPDDMPAHVKACFLGSSLTLPVTDGRLALGTWQGIWLCEHRNRAGSRKLMVTIQGCLRTDNGFRSSGSGLRNSRSPGNDGANSPLPSSSS